ncbi:Putative DUF827 domain containing family protein [Zea mays]|uniref:Putative DUF827 domain containing family protein n=1 Tax=Zea mays TaxID=4577 RepID=K7VI05_MAIZE|nr:Putative DUF827 domain containing family protein [Zea mays]
MEEANVHGTSGRPSTAPSDASPDSAVPSTSHQGSRSCEAQLDEMQEPDVDSVKGAVGKFGVGGVLDWREKRKNVQNELDKVQDEVTEYQKRVQEAESGRAQALEELGTAVSAADELARGLDRARAEQAQARQQAELAELQLEELRRGVAAQAKAELGAAMDRSAAALADLRAARAEVESLEKEHARAAAEAGAAVARAREAAAASREAGKAVEDLAAELAALKGELESSRAAHVEAEEKTRSLAVAWEDDKTRWQIELEEAEREDKRLREVEMKAEAASQLMASLKTELFACAVEGTPGQEEKPAASTQSMQEKTEKELDDVKASIEWAKDEVKCLRVAAASMRDELEKEKAELTALRRREREGLSPASIPYPEEELRRVTTEVAAAEAGAKADDDDSKMAERVGQARREAEEAKAKAQSAREKVARAREDAGVAKAALAAMEARLEAVTREILAADTSEVTLTVDDYNELRRRAQETEEADSMRVVEAVKLVEEAKDAEARKLEKVARLAKRTEQRRQALEAATLEADEAEFEKLSAERELRQWRAEHEQQRAPGETGSPRPDLAEISVLDDPAAGDGRGNPHIVSPRGGYMSAADAEDEDARQRKTFFPRIVMFLARKRAQT